MPDIPLTSTGEIDFTALLNQDPGLTQALKAINAQQTLEQSIWRGNQRAAFIQGGFTPSYLGLGTDQSQISPAVTGADISGVVDQPTLDLINAANLAGTSTYAQLQHAAAVNRANSLSHLAAANMLRSGALQGSEESLGLANRIATQNAVNTLQGQLGGFYQTYLSQSAADRAARAQATNEALQRIIQQILGGYFNNAAPYGPQTDTGLHLGGFADPRVDPTKDQPTTNINEGGQIVPEPKGLPPALNNPANNPFGAGGVLQDEAQQAAARAAAQQLANPTVTDVYGGQTIDYGPEATARINAQPNALGNLGADVGDYGTRSAAPTVPQVAPVSGYGTTSTFTTPKTTFTAPSTHYQVIKNML